MKIEVNQDVCIGCGFCTNTDEENFDYNPQGYAVVKNNNINENTIKSKEYCPVNAINIIEEK